MAYYKYSAFLTASNHELFDQLMSPGTTAPHSGIYRCEGCGQEGACNYSTPLPPQNHHQHSPAQGSIRWRLVVAT
jgi:hypothetical protein